MDNQPIKKSPFKEGGMFDQANPLIFEKAKELRKNMTEAEKLLWHYLKNGISGLKFRRQHPLGLYIADFYCHQVKLVIELDGEIHNKPNVKILDEEREANLRHWGCYIIRFDNNEVFQEMNKVLQTINQKVEELKISIRSSATQSTPFREDLGG